MDAFCRRFAHIEPLVATRIDDSGLRREELVIELDENASYTWVTLHDLFESLPSPTETIRPTRSDFRVRMPWGYRGNELFDLARTAEILALTAERLVPTGSWEERDGTTYRKQGSGKTEADVKRKRDLAFANFNENEGIDPRQGGFTVQEWGEFCLSELWPAELREKSLDSYRDNLEDHIYPLLGGLLLSELNAGGLQAFFNRASEKGLSRSSVLKLRTVLSSLVTRAQLRGHLQWNPVRLVKIKQEPTPNDESGADKRILTEKETEELLSFTEATYIHAADPCGVRMGMRAGECLGLTWENVDFESNSVRIRQQIQRIRGKGLVVVPPKSRAGFRSTPMPDSVRAYLLEERSRSTSAYVVSNAAGKPLEPSKLRKVFDNCAAMAGLTQGIDSKGKPLPAPTFHDLRSTFLTRMANDFGIKPRVLTQLAGLANIEITLQYYVPASDDSIMEAMREVK